MGSCFHACIALYTNICLTMWATNPAIRGCTTKTPSSPTTVLELSIPYNEPKITIDDLSDDDLANVLQILSRGHNRDMTRSAHLPFVLTCGRWRAVAMSQKLKIRSALGDYVSSMTLLQWAIEVAKCPYLKELRLTTSNYVYPVTSKRP